MPPTDLHGPESPAVQGMPRCKSCRHWQFDQTQEDYSREHTFCRPKDDDGKVMQMTFEVRICKHPAKTMFERPVEVNGFGLTDGSDYFAMLATAEDFGCVRHEVVL